LYNGVGVPLLKFCLLALALFTGVVVGQMPPAPYAVGFEPSFDDFRLVWHYCGVNLQDRGYDNGNPQCYYLVTHSGAQARATVEFDSVAVGAAIDQLSIFIWGKDPFAAEPGGPTSSFVLSIFDHLPLTIQDTALWGPFTVFCENVPPAGDWYTFPVHKQASVSGKLYAEFRWLPQTRTAPLPALDRRPGDFHTYRGYSQGGTLVWSPEPYGNLLLRLAFNQDDTLADVAHSGELPDSFAVHVSNDSSAEKIGEDVTITVRDSLHLELPRDQYQGKYFAVTAWEGGVASRPSTAVLLDPLAPLAFPLAMSADSVLVAPDSTVNLIVSNPTEYSLRCVFRTEAQPLPPWLQVLPAEVSIAPRDIDTVRMTMAGGGQFGATVRDTLVICCYGDAFTFRTHALIVAGRAEQQTDVSDGVIPESWATTLEQNFPNPFNGETIIVSASAGPITIYNALGKKVVILAGKPRSDAGDYRFEWDGRDSHGSVVPSGVYFYRQAGEITARKMIVLK
jgi:hypothetical protein